MIVSVEVLVFHLDQDSLKWRCLKENTKENVHPDETALQLVLGSGDNEPMLPKSICHSTSWRYENNEIILTYAFLPDPNPLLPSCPLHAVGTIKTSMDPLRPSPPNIDGDNVAAHAVLHLAELARRDPIVKAQSFFYPDLWQSIAQYSEHTLTQ